MKRALIPSFLLSCLCAIPAAYATPRLLAIGTVGGSSDLSGLTELLENDTDRGDVLGGIGSGLAHAGGNTFLALPDRGPNATEWEAAVDHTTSYISRFHTVGMRITFAPAGSLLPLRVTPGLSDTTLLFSSRELNYGPSIPSANTEKKHYFSGRSDNFLGQHSTNPRNARLDPEGIRVSRDGEKVYISDEYGPYVYEFDRDSGKRTRIFTLPAAFDTLNPSSSGDTEISGNASGRVANKGMEGLAITPDGQTLIGFEQSPLIQDGGDGGRANRIVAINIATGRTRQYVYDNYLAETKKSYNSSEIVAINSHEFLVLERDGKGLGDDSKAVIKRLYKIDLDGATDIGALNHGTGISGEANLLSYAVSKSLFLDIKSALNLYGLEDADIPAKLEGAAFGEDVRVDGTRYHTLWIANDNDFLPLEAGENTFFVFGFTDTDLGTDNQGRATRFVPQWLETHSCDAREEHRGAGERCHWRY